MIKKRQKMGNDNNFYYVCFLQLLFIYGWRNDGKEKEIRLSLFCFWFLKSVVKKKVWKTTLREDDHICCWKRGRRHVKNEMILYYLKLRHEVGYDSFSLVNKKGGSTNKICWWKTRKKATLFVGWSPHEDKLFSLWFFSKS